MRFCVLLLPLIELPDETGSPVDRSTPGGGSGVNRTSFWSSKALNMSQVLRTRPSAHPVECDSASRPAKVHLRGRSLKEKLVCSFQTITAMQGALTKVKDGDGSAANFIGTRQRDL